MAVTSNTTSISKIVPTQTESIPRAAGNKFIDPTVKNGKLGGQAKRKIDDLEDELLNSHGDANMVSADGAVELAGIQDGPMLLAQVGEAGAGGVGTAGGGTAGAGAGAAGGAGGAAATGTGLSTVLGTVAGVAVTTGGALAVAGGLLLVGKAAGGGGDSTPAVNNAPVITSTTAVPQRLR